MVEIQLVAMPYMGQTMKIRAYSNGQLKIRPFPFLPLFCAPNLSFTTSIIVAVIINKQEMKHLHWPNPLN